jgi:hypothetical protein
MNGIVCVPRRTANFGEILMQLLRNRSTMTVSDGGKPLLRIVRRSCSARQRTGRQGQPVGVNIASLSRWVCWPMASYWVGDGRSDRAHPQPADQLEPFVGQFDGANLHHRQG